MKKIILFLSLVVSSVFTSCGLLDVDDDYFTSIKDLYGTEWTYQDDQGTIGLKFYTNNQVLCFLENKYGIQTINGVYNYIESSKMLSFNGLTWYNRDTGKVAATFQGAHIVDSKTMKLTIQQGSGEIEYSYLYKQ